GITDHRRPRPWYARLREVPPPPLATTRRWDDRRGCRFGRTLAPAKAPPVPGDVRAGASGDDSGRGLRHGRRPARPLRRRLSPTHAPRDQAHQLLRGMADGRRGVVGSLRRYRANGEREGLGCPQLPREYVGPAPPQA